MFSIERIFFAILATLFIFVMIMAGIRWAKAESSYDGNWIVSITPSCDTSQQKTIGVVVINSKIKSMDQNLLDIQGSIGYSGNVSIVIKKNDGKSIKTIHSSGRVSTSSGSGSYQFENCPGTWKAARN